MANCENLCTKAECEALKTRINILEEQVFFLIQRIDALEKNKADKNHNHSEYCYQTECQKIEQIAIEAKRKAVQVESELYNHKSQVIPSAHKVIDSPKVDVSLSINSSSRTLTFFVRVDMFGKSGNDKASVNITGLKGEKGDRGEKGEKGLKGDRGIQGKKGDRGDRGERGEKGEKGDSGLTIGIGVIFAIINTQITLLKAQLKVQLKLELILELKNYFNVEFNKITNNFNLQISSLRVELINTLSVKINSLRVELNNNISVKINKLKIELLNYINVQITKIELRINNIDIDINIIKESIDMSECDLTTVTTQLNNIINIVNQLALNVTNVSNKVTQISITINNINNKTNTIGVNVTDVKNKLTPINKTVKLGHCISPTTQGDWYEYELESESNVTNLMDFLSLISEQNERTLKEVCKAVQPKITLTTLPPILECKVDPNDSTKKIMGYLDTSNFSNQDWVNVGLPKPNWLNKNLTVNYLNIMYSQYVSNLAEPKNQTILGLPLCNLENNDNCAILVDDLTVYQSYGYYLLLYWEWEDKTITTGLRPNVIRNPLQVFINGENPELIWNTYFNNQYKILGEQYAVFKTVNSEGKQYKQALSTGWFLNINEAKRYFNWIKTLTTETPKPKNNPSFNQSDNKETNISNTGKKQLLKKVCVIQKGQNSNDTISINVYAKPNT